MKHIFYGKENCYTYNFIKTYVSYFNVYNRPNNMELVQSKYICYNEKGLRVVFEVLKKLIKTQMVVLSETESITERILEDSFVNINNEEIHVDKVVQCENGDVLCYTDKVTKEIEDEEAKNEALETMEKEYKKEYEEYEKYEKRIQELEAKKEREKAIDIDNKGNNKKKWYQFWK